MTAAAYLHPSHGCNPDSSFNGAELDAHPRPSDERIAAADAKYARRHRTDVTGAERARQAERRLDIAQSLQSTAFDYLKAAGDDVVNAKRELVAAQVRRVRAKINYRAAVAATVKASCNYVRVTS